MSNSSESLSQFIKRILEQLSITAWLPAAMLIGAGTLLVRLHINRNLDIPQAFNDIANFPWGTIIIMIFGLVLTTMLTQACSFGAIRTLEGYWRSSPILDYFTKIRVRSHVKKALKQRAKRDKIRISLFESARQSILQWDGRDALEAYENEVLDVPLKMRRAQPEEVVERAFAVDWTLRGDPGLAAIYSRAQLRSKEYPLQEGRFLPTKLGNVLRATEETLRLKGTKLERFVMDNYDKFPPRLMIQHDNYRDRLDMYSLLVLVYLSLAVAAVPLLLFIEKPQAWIPPATGGLVFFFLAWISYFAAIASARGYCSVLISMNDAVNSTK